MIMEPNKSTLVPKLIFTALLVVLSFVPSELIQSLVAERETTQTAAAEEVSEKWSGVSGL